MASRLALRWAAQRPQNPPMRSAWKNALPGSGLLRSPTQGKPARHRTAFTTGLDRSHAPRGHAAPDALRPAGHGYLEGDAERHWMHSHAERGNDQEPACHRTALTTGCFFASSPSARLPTCFPGAPTGRTLHQSGSPGPAPPGVASGLRRRPSWRSAPLCRSRYAG